jgi:hypothetical protein
MTTTSDWDWQAVSRDFFEIAQEAYRRSGECRSKMHDDPGSQIEYEDHMARFSVYSHLYDKSFLARREDLLAELHRMLDDPVVQRPTGVADMEFFEQSRAGWIRKLIGNLESGA